MITLTVTKRTVLTGLYAVVGATFVLTPRGIPLAALLLAAGTFLGLAPEGWTTRRPTTVGR